MKIINPIMNENTITFPPCGGPRASFGKLCLVLPNDKLGLHGTQPASMHNVGFVPVYLERQYINQLQLNGNLWYPFATDEKDFYWVLPLKRQIFSKTPFYSHKEQILDEAKALFPDIEMLLNEASFSWEGQVANVSCGDYVHGFHYCYRIVLCNADWTLLTGTPFATQKVDDYPMPDQIDWNNPTIDAAKINGVLPLYRQWMWYSNDASTIANAENFAKELSKLHPDLCVAFGRNVPNAYPGVPKSKLYVRYFMGGKAYKEIPENLKEVTK